MSKTCIISGINGQLGQFLAKYLQVNHPNIQIVGTIRHKSYDNQPYIFDRTNVIFELMDLCDVHSIENLIIKYKPEFFINTAANAFVGESWNVPIQQFEQNCIGVIHQLEAIRKHSCHTRYFNMGTSEEFANDINDGKLQDENTLINPKSPYGCAKAGARYMVNTYRNSYGIYAIQGWTFNFESEIRGEKYVTRKITKGVARISKAIQNKESFTPISLGNINSMRSWQFAGDVADGIWRMLNQEVYNKDIKQELSGRNILRQYYSAEQHIEWLSKRIKTYVMSSSECHTVKEFIEEAFKCAGFHDCYWIGESVNEKYLLPNYLCEELGLENAVLVDINPEFLRPHDVTYLNGDASRIKSELGWQSTVSFKDLVKRMVDSDLKIV